MLSELRKLAMAWLRDRPDDKILRGLFASMVVVTVAWLGVDYFELYGATSAPRAASTSTPSSLPSSLPLPFLRRADRGDPQLPRFDEALRTPMTFDLAPGGRLMANGTIVPGTAMLFAAEVEKRGSYVTTVVLASPGGSVSDALAMGRLIREKKFTTEVEGGHYCASSCPLVLAGGSVRRVGTKAAVGVHQVSAIAPGGARADEGMQDAQLVSAACQRYLSEMGVDPAVWVHAMETPSDRLFYLRPDELVALKLATEITGPEAHTAALGAKNPSE
jgi:hypothetical protein